MADSPSVPDSPTVPMVLSPEAIAEIERRANAPKPIPFVGQMGGPTLSPEILAEIQRRADAAKGGANVSREPLASVAPQESTEPIGPPPPPPAPAAEKTPILDAAKRGLIQAGTQAVLGPAAGFAAGAKYGWQGENAPSEAGMAAKGAEAAQGQPSDEEYGQEGAQQSQGQPAMQAGLSAPFMVSPGGMQLDQIQTHFGKQVPDETFALSKAGTDLQLRGARLHSEADRAFADQQKALMAAQMDAAERARIEHEAVQAQRDAEVKKRLGEIEHFNAQANQKIGADLFSHGPLSGIMGAIAIGLGQYSAAINRTENMAAKLIESNINREIQIQIENIKNAKGNADNAKGLLSMHLQRFGDMDRAIDATKIALYDQAVKQLDAFRAQHGAQVSEANYNDTAGKLLNERGLLLNKLGVQIQNDVVQTEKMRAPVFAGGGGGGGGESPGYLVSIPDGNGKTSTVVSFDSKELKNKAVEQIYFLSKLQEMNNHIKQERLAMRDLNPVTDREAWAQHMLRLEDLGERKLKLVENAYHQGVLREGEKPDAQRYTAHATTGLNWAGQSTGGVGKWLTKPRFEAANKALDAQTLEFQEDMARLVKSGVGRVVQPGYNVDPMTGQLSVGDRLTGQDALPTSNLAPRGSRAQPGFPQPPTQGAPLREQLPPSPVFGVSRPKKKKEK